VNVVDDELCATTQGSARMERVDVDAKIDVVGLVHPPEYPVLDDVWGSLEPIAGDPWEPERETANLGEAREVRRVAAEVKEGLVARTSGQNHADRDSASRHLTCPAVGVGLVGPAEGIRVCAGWSMPAKRREAAVEGLPTARQLGELDGLDDDAVRRADFMATGNGSQTNE